MLLEDIYPIHLQRMDDAHAFVGGKIEDTYNLYYLTPTEAIPVMELFDQSYVDEFRRNAISDGYAYLMPEIIAAGENRYLIADRKRDQYALFDVEQGSTTSIDLRAWCNDDCVRVSADGWYIRYRVSPYDPEIAPPFSEAGENALPYHIYEYDTDMETERLIYEQETIDFVEGRDTLN